MNELEWLHMRISNYRIPTKEEQEKIQRAWGRPPMSKEEIERILRTLPSGLPKGETKIR